MEKNKMIFRLEDNTHKNIYNETCELKKEWFGTEHNSQILDIETYFYMCKEFALAMGFGEKTVNEWFE